MNESRRRALVALLGLPVSVAAQGCLGTEPPAPFEPAPDRIASRKRLLALGDEYEALMRRHGELAFRAATQPAPSGDPLSELRRQEVALTRRAERLLEYHEALLPPSLTRAWQLSSLGLALLEDRETRELEAKLGVAQLAPIEVAGESLGRSEVESLLRSPRPEERDAAASALDALQSRCEPKAKELLLRRRVRARELGEDYYDVLLRVRRVNLERLEHLAQAFVRGTDSDARALSASLRRMLRVAMGRKRGQSAGHDLEFALQRLTLVPESWFPEEKALDIARGVAARLGLDAAARHLRSLRSVSAMSCSGEALSVPVRIPGDVRPLSRKASGISHWSDVLGELGRVVQLTRIEEREPLFKGYPWIPGMADVAFDRGFAEIFSSLLARTQVLEDAGLSGRQSTRVVATRRMSRLFELRRSIAWMTFERRALANPKQDLARLAGQSNARLTGLNTPIFWATDRRLVECPGIEPAALLGALLACDVHDWLGEEADDDSGPKLTSTKGHQLVESLLSHGVERSIDEKLITLRGRRLSARAAVFQLTRPRPQRQRAILL